MVTTTVALSPPASGSRSAGVALDVLDERLPQPGRRGPLGDRRVALDRGEVLGCGQGEDGLLEHGSHGGGQREPAAGPAVAVVDHRQRRRLVGLRFLLGEERGLVGVGGLGVDDLQQPPAENPQCLGVVVLGLGEQERLRLGAGAGVDLLGQRIDGLDDDRGLVRQQTTARQGSPDRLVLLGGQGLGELGPAGRLGAGHAGLAGPPHRRRRRPRLIFDVAGLGLCRHGRLRPAQAGAQPGQHGQGRTQLVVAHRPRRDVAQLAELGLDPGERHHDRVSRSGWGARVGHRSIAAATTDTEGCQNRQNGGYSQSRHQQYFRSRSRPAQRIIRADFDERLATSESLVLEGIRRRAEDAAGPWSPRQFRQDPEGWASPLYPLRRFFWQ